MGAARVLEPLGHGEAEVEARSAPGVDGRPVAIGRRTRRELDARRADAARRRGRRAEPSLFAGNGRLRLVPRFELSGEPLVANDDLRDLPRARSAAPGRNARPAGPAAAPAVVRVPSVVPSAAPVARRTAPVARPTAATYRRRRLVAGALALAVLLAVLLGAGWAVGTLTSSSSGDAGAATTATIAGAQPVSRHTYVVQPGDTLWSIARKIQAPASAERGDDLRPVVDALAAQRNGRPLEVGETIVLP